MYRVENGVRHADLSASGSSTTPPRSVSRARYGYASDNSVGGAATADRPASQLLGQYSTTIRKIAHGAIALRHRVCLRSSAVRPRPQRIAPASHAKKKIRIGHLIPGTTSQILPGIGSHLAKGAGLRFSGLSSGPSASRYEMTANDARSHTTRRDSSSRRATM